MIPGLSSFLNVEEMRALGRLRTVSFTTKLELDEERAEPMPKFTKEERQALAVAQNQKRSREIRERHEATILAFLRKNGPTTPETIRAVTGIKFRAYHNVMKNLRECGLAEQERKGAFRWTAL